MNLYFGGAPPPSPMTFLDELKASSGKRLKKVEEKEKVPRVDVFEAIRNRTGMLKKTGLLHPDTLETIPIQGILDLKSTARHDLLMGEEKFRIVGMTCRSVHLTLDQQVEFAGDIFSTLAECETTRKSRERYLSALGAISEPLGKISENVNRMTEDLVQRNAKVADFSLRRDRALTNGNQQDADLFSSKIPIFIEQSRVAQENITTLRKVLVEDTRFMKGYILDPLVASGQAQVILFYDYLVQKNSLVNKWQLPFIAQSFVDFQGKAIPNYELGGVSGITSARVRQVLLASRLASYLTDDILSEIMAELGVKETVQDPPPPPPQLLSKIEKDHILETSARIITSTPVVKSAWESTLAALRATGKAVVGVSSLAGLAGYLGKEFLPVVTLPISEVLTGLFSQGLTETLVVPATIVAPSVLQTVAELLPTSEYAAAAFSTISGLDPLLFTAVASLVASGCVLYNLKGRKDQFLASMPNDSGEKVMSLLTVKGDDLVFEKIPKSLEQEATLAQDYTSKLATIQEKESEFFTPTESFFPVEKLVTEMVDGPVVEFVKENGVLQPLGGNEPQEEKKQKETHVNLRIEVPMYPFPVTRVPIIPPPFPTGKLTSSYAHLTVNKIRRARRRKRQGNYKIELIL